MTVKMNRGFSSRARRVVSAKSSPGSTPDKVGRLFLWRAASRSCRRWRPNCARYRVDVIVEQVDLSNVPAVIQLHQQLRERGIAIDILINNAGHGLQGTFVDGTLDAALAMLQLDVVSLTAVTHVFAQDMRTRGRGKILLVASMLAYQGIEKFAVYAAAKMYVLRLGEALHRELKRDGVTVTVLCPGMSDTGFATAAQQKITPALKLLMMQPAPVVRAGIRALQARRISVVPGWANKATVMFTRATPRWLHQAVFSRIMGAATDRGNAQTASVTVARR